MMKIGNVQVALHDVYAHIPNLPSNNCLSHTLYSSPLSLLFYNYTIASLSLIIIVLIIIHVHAAYLCSVIRMWAPRVETELKVKFIVCL